MTDETLASWKDGPARRAIVGFVTNRNAATPRGGGQFGLHNVRPIISIMSNIPANCKIWQGPYVDVGLDGRH